jgi:hypothetical protein
MVAGARFGLSLPIQENAKMACLLDSPDREVHLELMGEDSENPLYRLFHLADVAAGCLPILKKIGRPAKTITENKALSALC